MSAAFDTHEFIKKLTATGLTEPQAEVLSAAIRDNREPDLSILSTLATKEDLRLVKEDLHVVKGDLHVVKEGLRAVKEDLRAVKEEMERTVERTASATKEALRQDIHDLEIRLMKWTFAMLAGQAALIVALLKLM